jgi:HlyD family secretion protein
MNQVKTKKRSRKLIWILVGVLALLVIAATIKARQKPKGEEVTMEPVAKHTIFETVSASGKIFPETEIKISSDVSGEIIELYVNEGDSVTIGQILAKIRPDEYESAVERGEASLQSAKSQKEITEANVLGSKAQIDQLQSELDRAKAMLVATNATFKRNEQLFAEGVISQADFDASLANLKSGQATVTSAAASLEAARSSATSASGNVRVAGYGIASASATVKELRTSLQKTIIRAPMSGIISKLSVEKGERVVGTLQMSGTELMRVADMSKMEVQVEVSESDILKLTKGDSTAISVDAYLGRNFAGIVHEIGNSANNMSSSLGGSVSLNTDQVTNFIVKILVDRASYADLVQRGKPFPFRPGMSASVDIYTDAANQVIAVPIVAVTARDPEKDKKEDKDAPKKEEKSTSRLAFKEIVFVMVNDTVAEREVISGLQDNDFIEIKSGLTEGEVVITGPYSAITRTLKTGTKVHEKKEKDGAKGSGFSVKVE